MGDSTLELITELCRRFESDTCSLSKLRSKAYEILLRKSETPAPRLCEDPAVELLSYYFIKSASRKNISDFKDVQLLKQNVDRIFDEKLQEQIPFFNEVLTCIVALRETICNNRNTNYYEHPFTLGQLDKIIPPVAYTGKNEPKPYLHIPWQFFVPQFDIFEHKNSKTSNLYHYPSELFNATPGSKLLHLNPSLTCDQMKNDSPKDPSSYMQFFEEFQSFPRLLTPRDLSIPNEKLPSNNIVFKTHSIHDCADVNQNAVESGPPATLWELASIEANIPPDIWEEASKLPASTKRLLISSSSCQMSHWKRAYFTKIKQLHVISESLFILHLKYLTMGIESDSFIYDSNLGKFVLKPDLCLEGLSQMTLRFYVADIIKTGSCYRLLNDLLSNSFKKEHDGFVYKATRDNIKQYLDWFRLEMDEIFGEGLVTLDHENAKLPTLAEIVKNLKPLGIQIQSLARIYMVYETENSERYLGGAGLMACLYKEITLLTNDEVTKILYSTLKSTCTVYFRFIQEFIFEGELNDQYDEFFIRKEEQHVESFSKRYWDKGFSIRSDEVIPEFLRGMAKYILLCGKSLRLLKLCSPDHPLCIMLSSNYPKIKCCLTFDEIKNQQTLYDHYRTQCMYVCGEPVTFHSLMLKKDIERRTYREILALKQPETMNRILEERKRLSRIIHGNKMKQLSILKNAAENAATKRKDEKEKAIKEDQMFINQSLISDKTHKLKLEAEKKEVTVFYEKIEEEIMKRQMIADWKIKRLQLDKKRLKLITGEKLDLNREQLELKYDRRKDNALLTPVENEKEKLDVISSKNNMQLDIAINENKIFTIDETSATQLNIENNNIREINDQIEAMNKTILNQLSDVNKNLVPDTDELSKLSASDIVNSNILTTTNMDAYKQQRLEALKNKQKVLSHEFGTVSDEEFATNVNNQNLSHDDISSELNKNKRKILGSNFNNKDDIFSVKKFQEVPQYDTEASRQALKNKQKVLGHEFGIEIAKPILTNNNKRSNLTLDLQKSLESIKFKSIPNTPSNLDTPLDITVGLDVDTPSNFEIGPFGLPSNSVLSPSGTIPEFKDEINSKHNENFSFPIVIEEYNSDGDISPDSEPCEIDFSPINDACSYNVKSSVWNFVNDELNFENFKPFGIESTAQKEFSFDLFKGNFSLEKKSCPYSNINDIIDIAKNKPMDGIFKMINAQDGVLVNLNKIDNIDQSSMAMCLQRSIMIPLSCQMEMVNNAILKYFLADCDLYEHLKNIRDFFFLMDGEFAKSFCNILFEKLNITRNPKDLLNFVMLHKILRKSHESSFSGANKYIDNLSFVAADTPATFHYASPNILECLSLTYTAAWPLNIILSQEAMERYSKIFKFLVKLRRISWVLEHDSEVLKMSLKEEFMISRELLYSPQYRSVQMYRYIMSSLIRALHGYILNTCLQSSWLEFEKDMSDARTLDDLYSSHVIYIKKVLFRCLLNNRSAVIMKILNNIFCVILSFHHSLNSRCWHIAENEIHYTHPLFSEMRDLFGTFEKLAKYFGKTVTKLVDCGYQPHLAELLSMINMNDYYKN